MWTSFLALSAFGPTFLAMGPRTAVAFSSMPSSFVTPHQLRKSGGLMRPSSAAIYRRNDNSLSMALDPHSFTSFLLSVDETVDAISTAVAPAVDAAADMAASAGSAVTDMGATAGSAVTDVAANAGSAADTAAAVAGPDNSGFFGFLTAPIMGGIQIVHSLLVMVGVGANTWGVSILGLTIIIKLLTYPLTKQQLDSTNKMQALQPTIKELQTRYQSNPDVMNQKIAEVYQTNEVNPLAGCIPALVQLPVFIGLYRAILQLAKEDKLNEPFLWLPNLEGPTYGADPAHGSDWLLQGWEDGVPSLGWDATIAFLSLPVLLVVTQFISQALITPKNSEQSNNFVLKLLPLLIGWFSVNVPAALGIYWVANNIITTLITLQIRAGLDTAPASAGGGSAGSSVMEPPPPPNVFQPPPMREKPSGFAAPVVEDVVTDDDGVKPITPIDAEIVEPPSVSGFAEEEEAAPEVPQPRPAPTKKGKRGKRKKKKGSKK